MTGDSPSGDLDFAVLPALPTTFEEILHPQTELIWTPDMCGRFSTSSTRLFKSTWPGGQDSQKRHPDSFERVYHSSCPERS